MEERVTLYGGMVTASMAEATLRKWDDLTPREQERAIDRAELINRMEAVVLPGKPDRGRLIPPVETSFNRAATRRRAQQARIEQRRRERANVNP